MVAPGKIVAFKTYLNGTAAAAAGWKWLPNPSTSWDSVAGCTAGDKCYRAMFVSGTMKAWDGGPEPEDTSSVGVTVNEGCGSMQVAPLKRGTILSSQRPSTRDLVCPPGGGEGSAEAAAASQNLLHVLALVDTASPGSGDHSYAVSSIVPYHFANAGNTTDSIAVFVDSVLRRPDSTITMDHEHSIKVLPWCSAQAQDSNLDIVSDSAWDGDTSALTACADSITRSGWQSLGPTGDAFRFGACRNRPALCAKLFTRWWRGDGNGGTYHLPNNEFDPLSDAVSSVLAAHDGRILRDSTGNFDAIYDGAVRKVQVKTSGTLYDTTIGTAWYYFDSSGGYVGFIDTYDFNEDVDRGPFLNTAIWSLNRLKPASATDFPIRWP